jgi:hypothetical protein
MLVVLGLALVAWHYRRELQAYVLKIWQTV